ncbi:MAG TPA: beta-ketoacyl synthase chain length factor [Puia sp.]|nr:beta-ketoacyl synthase chain length factor [Puia sp.]
MRAYIISTGNISPQHSMDMDAFFQSRKETSNNFFNALEPDYTTFIDSKMIRRMSRIVKMGVAASTTCLRNAGVEMPAAILTATAYGCLEDSATFLRKMIEFDEEMLSPTAFIQSTHNTVGAQIALLLKCHHYNNTIVHRAFSLENALMEAGLLLEEGISPVLVGAIDEITNDRHTILSRFGLYKRDSGNIAGEGAAFFLLSKEPGNAYQAILKAVQTYYKPAILQEDISQFLTAHEMDNELPGLILHADTGNEKANQKNREVLKTAFPDTPEFAFKSLCGDFPTSSGFALWFASLLLKEQRVPVWMHGIKFPLKNIFIHQQDGLHHSLYLISS